MPEIHIENQKHWDSAYLRQGTSNQYGDTDPDHHQNLIVCSLAHCQPSVNISCKSVREFLRKVANKQTDRQTTTKTTTIYYRQSYPGAEFTQSAHHGGNIPEPAVNRTLSQASATTDRPYTVSPGVLPAD